MELTLASEGCDISVLLHFLLLKKKINPSTPYNVFMKATRLAGTNKSTI